MTVIRFSDLCAQGQVAGKRVFIRADLNVPQDAEGRITDDSRIRASVACIQMALDAGAAVMVTSHRGHPTEGEFKLADSLLPVAMHLSELLKRPLPLLPHWLAGVPVATGQVLLLENCSLNPGENKNSEALSRQMAGLCDIFVHDASDTAHQAQASTCGMAEYAKVACVGPLLAAELNALGDNATVGPTLPAFEMLARRGGAAKPAAAVMAPSFDPVRGVSMLGSDASLRKILKTVASSMTDSLPQITAALSAGDVHTANGLLHAIKGYVPIFATDAMVTEVAQVEKLSKTEPLTVVATPFAQLMPRLEGLLAEIRVFLAQN